MNRNVMYDYLKEKGMYAMFIWADDRKSYHTEFRLQPHQNDCYIITDWGYIRHVQSIHLCMNEVVIVGGFGDLKVNINYKDMQKFEVRIWEE